MLFISRLFVVLALTVAGLGTAAAQGADPPGGAVAPTAVAPAVADPNAAAYQSPLRQQCSDEIEKDPGWKADISKKFEYAAHAKAADAIQRNERHVFIAYAVIWILVAGFVAVMWLRQGKLNSEIKRLEDELRRVERDEKGGAG